jgi:hypothetical protein
MDNDYGNGAATGEGGEPRVGCKSSPSGQRGREEGLGGDDGGGGGESGGREGYLISRSRHAPAADRRPRQGGAAAGAAYAVHAPCMPLYVQKDNTGGKAVSARPMGINAPPSLANLMAGAESAAAAAAALAPPLLSQGTQASQTPAAGAGGSGAAVLGGSLPEFHDTGGTSGSGGVPLSSPPSYLSYTG